MGIAEPLIVNSTSLQAKTKKMAMRAQELFERIQLLHSVIEDTNMLMERLKRERNNDSIIISDKIISVKRQLSNIEEVLIEDMPRIILETNEIAMMTMDQAAILL